MGELRQRGKVWWIRFYRNGVRHEESSRSKLKTVAENLLKVREGDVAKGIPVPSRTFKFEDGAKLLKADYGANKRKSASVIERQIRLHLEPYFGGKKLADIRTSHALAFVAHRQEQGAANGEINRELAALRRMYRLAMRSGELVYRPEIPMLKERDARQGVIEADEFARVRAALPAAVRPVVTFAYVCGWRVQAEVIGLQWRQVDRKAMTVTLDAAQSKNGKARVLDYSQSPDLVEVMADQWHAKQATEKANDQVCPWVFHRAGKPIRNFRGAWATACEAAGVPGRIIHDLRRTAVRNLVRAGVAEKTAMEISGHMTRSVFDRYNITDLSDRRQGLAKLPALPSEAPASSSKVRKIR